MARGEEERGPQGRHAVSALMYLQGKKIQEKVLGEKLVSPCQRLTPQILGKTESWKIHPSTLYRASVPPEWAWSGSSVGCLLGHPLYQAYYGAVSQQS